MIEKFKDLKKKESSSEAVQMKAKANSLELALQLAIEKHDDLLSENSKLKWQVTEGRVCRKNLKQQQVAL